MRLLKHEDIRKGGSGNVGATNVWRTYGARYGVPVVLARYAEGLRPGAAATLLRLATWRCDRGRGAMVGHWRPLFLGFAKGGKMVATCGGAFLGVAPLVGGSALSCGLSTFSLFRYASVASIIAASRCRWWPSLLEEPWPVIAFAALAALAVLVLHRPNISRLRAGTETRFRFRRPATP